MKSNRSARKRFKITAKGKVKRWRGGGAHYNTKKDKRRKRHLKRHTYVNKSWEDKVKGLLKQW